MAEKEVEQRRAEKMSKRDSDEMPRRGCLRGTLEERDELGIEARDLRLETRL